MQNDKHRGSLGSRFEGFGSAPSEGLWDAITQDLDGKKKRRGIIWWWFGSGIAAVGIVAFMTIYFGDEESINSVEITGTSKTRFQLKPDGRLSIEHNNDSHNSSSGEIEMESMPKNSEADSENRKERIEEPGESTSTDAYRSLTLAELPIGVQQGVIPERINISKLPISSPNLIDGSLSQDLEQLAPITDEAKEKSGNWELGVTLNHWNSFRNPLLATEETPIEEDSEAFLGLDDEALVTSNPTVRASRPLGAKFYVGYRLGKRWRITSGLSIESTKYSYVKNQFVTNNVGADLPFYPEPARIVSVGVPVNVEFDFIRKKRFQMGVGMGVLNEIPVFERYQPTYYDLNYEGPETKSSKFNSGYGFTVNSGLIFGYYLTEFMRLRATTGFRYYFKQNVKTSLDIPKRPLWAGGSFGVVWELH